MGAYRAFKKGGPMARLLIVIGLLCMLVSVPAFGQGGFISGYADPSGVDCVLTEIAPPSVVFVYLFHHNTPGVVGSQFKVEQQGTFWTYLNFDTFGQPTLGAPETGVAVCYAACVTSPYHIGTIAYFAFATSPPCSELRVVPDPNALSGTIEVFDCSVTKLVGSGGVLHVNGDGSCNCYIANAEIQAAAQRDRKELPVDPSGSSFLAQCISVPLETDTWGHIKALYR